MILLAVLHRYFELRVQYSARQLLIIQHLAIIGVLAGTSGCTLPPWYAADVAHVATIYAIVPLPEVPTYADVNCLGRLQTPADSSGAAAIIFHRVGRFRYYFALPVKSEDGWHVGEKIRFNENSCTIQAK